MSRPEGVAESAEVVARLFERYHAVVYRLSGDVEVARDLTQETFLKALRGYSGFRGEATQRTWLYRIALNTVYGHRREIQKRSEGRLVELEAVDESALTAKSNPEADLLRAEQRAQVRRALAQVPLKLRMVLVLKDVAGFSCDEIADLTKLRPGTIASRLNRARLRLAALLATQVQRPEDK